MAKSKKHRSDSAGKKRKGMYGKNTRAAKRAAKEAWPSGHPKAAAIGRSAMA